MNTTFFELAARVESVVLLIGALVGHWSSRRSSRVRNSTQIKLVTEEFWSLSSFKLEFTCLSTKLGWNIQLTWVRNPGGRPPEM